MRSRRYCVLLLHPILAVRPPDDLLLKSSVSIVDWDLVRVGGFDTWEAFSKNLTSAKKRCGHVRHWSPCNGTTKQNYKECCLFTGQSGQAWPLMM